MVYLKEILEKAKDLSKVIIEDRRYLHQHPEIGLDLPITTQYVWDRLVEMGYSPIKYGASIGALVGRGEKTFLIRGDMDGLSIEEDTGLEFKSKTKGRMHACGHDCHTAMLLGAARLLKDYEDDLKGQVKIFFQAGEESLEGAKEAIDQGLMENPRVDGGMMIHIMSNTPIKEGSIVFPTHGPAYASADWFRVDVVGKGGHGALPSNTISSINTICAINMAIQELISVGVPSSTDAVVTVGEIHAGGLGGTNNIIPDKAYLAGTIRTYDEEVRKTLKEKLAILVDNIGKSRGAKAMLSYGHSAPPVENNKELKEFAMEKVSHYFGDNSVVDLSEFMDGKFRRVNGSEDFAFIAEKVPGLVAFLAAGSPAKGYSHPAHNPKTDFDESVLYLGSATYALIAMEWLKENS